MQRNIIQLTDRDRSLTYYRNIEDWAPEFGLDQVFDQELTLREHCMKHSKNLKKKSPSLLKTFDLTNMNETIRWWGQRNQLRAISFIVHCKMPWRSFQSRESYQNFPNFVILKKKSFCWRFFNWNYTDSLRRWCSSWKSCLFDFELKISRNQRQQ